MSAGPEPDLYGNLTSTAQCLNCSGQDAADDPAAQSGHDQGDDDDNEDAERPHDEVRDRRRRVRADAELGQEVVEPAPALIDLIAVTHCPQGAHQGRERRRGERGHGRYSVPESAL